MNRAAFAMPGMAIDQNMPVIGPESARKGPWKPPGYGKTPGLAPLSGAVRAGGITGRVFLAIGHGQGDLPPGHCAVTGPG